MKIKMSPYTISKNCTDLADIECGLLELKNILAASKPPRYAYTRYVNLIAKKQKLTK